MIRPFNFHIKCVYAVQKGGLAHPCSTKQCRVAVTMLNGTLPEIVQVTTVKGVSALWFFTSKSPVGYTGNCTWVCLFFMESLMLYK